MHASAKSPIIAGVLGAAWLMGGASTAKADHYYPSVYCAPSYATHAYHAPVYYERDVYVRPRSYYYAPRVRPRVVYHRSAYYPTRHVAPRYYHPPRRHYVRPVRSHRYHVSHYRPSYAHRSYRYATPYRASGRSSFGFSYGRSHYGRSSSRHFGFGFSLRR